MRKRFYHERVCSCSPSAGMVYIQTRLLEKFVNWGVRTILCASTCGRKGLRAMTIGDLCAESGHHYWARKVWIFAVHQIHSKDYDDWIGEWFNPRYVRLQDVISDGLCEILGRRIDAAERRCGLAWSEWRTFTPDRPAWRDTWEYGAGTAWYDYFRYEKFDYDVDELREECIRERNEAMAWQSTARLFSQGQCELPPQAQDFFCYWADFDPTAQDEYYKVDDWDE